MFEDAAGFDFLHGQGLLLKIQKDISHLHILCGRMRADLPHPIYFHQKAYWISGLGITELLVPRFLFRADVVKVKSECVEIDA